MSDFTNNSTPSAGREVFFHLLGFFTLAITAIALGALIFQVINKYFSSEVINAMWSYNSSGLRLALSALIVVAPVYFFVTRYMIKFTSQGKVQVNSKLKRVLTYIVLFVACAIILGDVITLVFRFVAGETNVRFLLKVITLLFMGGWLGWYYWESLKGEQIVKPDTKWYQYHAWAFIIMWVVAVVGGFVLAGNPQEQQKVVRDNVRIEHLQQISNLVINEYNNDVNYKALPANLESIGQAGYINEFKDPLTNLPYEYIMRDGSVFELCAIFETASENYTTPSLLYGVLYKHSAGRYCFTLNAAKPL